MTGKPLSKDFIKNLLKKEVPVQNHTYFTEGERKIIREAVSNENIKTFTLREKLFKVRRFIHQKENWVTIKPVEGFVPLVQGPVNYIMNKETEL